MQTPEKTGAPTKSRTWNLLIRSQSKTYAPVSHADSGALLQHKPSSVSPPQSSTVTPELTTALTTAL